MLQCILERNTLQKYDLQESYNNFKIKLKIYFCESGQVFNQIKSNQMILFRY